MTKKDFFILIIKLFGLYSIVTALLISLPQSLSFIVSNFELRTLLYFLLILIVIVALFILLIFKSHHIVSFLKLEKGFDDDKIELGNLSTSEIVKIGTFVIGGFLIINHIPVFLNQTFNAFYSDIQSLGITPNYKWNWIVSGLNIVIGYLLISNLNFIVRLLRLQNKNEK